MKPWRAVKANTMKTSQKKLCSKAMAPKYYWSLLKTMLNDKKVHCISPIFHDKKFITDFSKKADLFNSFLCKAVLNYRKEQCSSLIN